jgi:predicted alpha/beta-hydrolase family hydrolase
MEIVTGPADASVTFLFAHGAGAPMDSAFMNVVADGLSARGVRVVRFEFPYMAERRKTGKGRGPDRSPALLQTFRDRVAVERARIGAAKRLAIGGKSMGGRIASMIADEVSADALICLGYPFWPPAKKGEAAQSHDRIRHLETLRTKALILQGTRDSFGGEDAVSKLRITPRIEWLPDGDHDFAPRKRSGHTHEQNLATAVDRAATFLLAS